MFGNKDTMTYKEWPKYDEILASEDEVEIAIQVNGKLRGSIKIAKDTEDQLVTKESLKLPKVSKQIENKEIIKVIYIKNKLINFVVPN